MLSGCTAKPSWISTAVLFFQKLLSFIYKEYKVKATNFVHKLGQDRACKTSYSSFFFLFLGNTYHLFVYGSDSPSFSNKCQDLLKTWSETFVLKSCERGFFWCLTSLHFIHKMWENILNAVISWMVFIPLFNTQNACLNLVFCISVVSIIPTPSLSAAPALICLSSADCT